MADRQSPIKTILNDNKSANLYTDDELVDIGVQFLQEQTLLHCCCKSKLNGRNKKCECLTIFAEEDDADEYPLTRAVARFMVYFGKKKKSEQQMLVIEWIKYGAAAADARDPTPYLLPVLVDDDDVDDADDEAGDPINADGNAIAAYNRKICESALLTIIGYSRTFWTTCKQCAKEGTIPTHGLAGRPPNNSISDELSVELHLFFADMQDFAEPIATRFIREKTGELDTRDEDDDVLQLAPSFSKRGLYQRFCYERGWKIETTAKGNPKKKKRTDEGWAAGEEPLDICSWTAFRCFWQKNYPKLRVVP